MDSYPRVPVLSARRRSSPNAPLVSGSSLPGATATRHPAARRRPQSTHRGPPEPGRRRTPRRQRSATTWFSAEELSTANEGPAGPCRQASSVHDDLHDAAPQLSVPSGRRRRGRQQPRVGRGQPARPRPVTVTTPRRLRRKSGTVGAPSYRSSSSTSCCEGARSRSVGTSSTPTSSSIFRSAQ